MPLGGPCAPQRFAERWLGRIFGSVSRSMTVAALRGVVEYGASVMPANKVGIDLGLVLVKDAADQHMAGAPFLFTGFLGHTGLPEAIAGVVCLPAYRTGAQEVCGSTVGTGARRGGCVQGRPPQQKEPRCTRHRGSESNRLRAGGPYNAAARWSCRQRNRHGRPPADSGTRQGSPSWAWGWRCRSGAPCRRTRACTDCTGRCC